MDSKIMKTRIVKTRYWKDQVEEGSPKDARYLYSYFIDCEHINISGIFQLSDSYIMLETALTKKELEKTKKYLTDKRHVLFFKGWIYVVNALKENRYDISPKNKEAYRKELEIVPKEIIEHFNKILDSTIHSTSDTTIDSSQKSEIRNQNTFGGVEPFTAKDVEYLQNIPEDHLEIFVEKHSPLTREEVQDEALKAYHWVMSAYRKNKKEDYRHFLHNWLGRTTESKKPKNRYQVTEINA